MRSRKKKNFRRGTLMKVQLTKLKRRSNPENPAYPLISDGQGVIGEFKVPTPALIKYWEEEVEVPEGDPYYEIAGELKPIIGHPILVGDLPTGIRTSRIRSYYVHEKPDEHPDKLVLPANFPIKEVEGLDMNKLDKGDMILATMNSLYLVRPY